MPKKAKSTKSAQKEVLIIEDDPFLVHAYQLKFEKEGMKSKIYTSGKDAIDMLDTEKPSSVVLLDLMLPGVNGFEILESIKKHPDWKKVPVIIVSNLGQQADIDRGQKLGAADYVTKADSRIADIIQKVRKFI